MREPRTRLSYGRPRERMGHHEIRLQRQPRGLHDHEVQRPGWRRATPLLLKQHPDRALRVFGREVRPAGVKKPADERARVRVVNQEAAYGRKVEVRIGGRRHGRPFPLLMTVGDSDRGSPITRSATMSFCTSLAPP